MATNDTATKTNKFRNTLSRECLTEDKIDWNFILKPFRILQLPFKLFLHSKRAIYICSTVTIIIIWIFAFSAILFSLLINILRFISPQTNIKLDFTNTVTEAVELGVKINCSFDFIFINRTGLCLPPCGWHPADENMFHYQLITFLIIDSLGILFGILCLISVMITLSYNSKTRRLHNFLKVDNFNMARIALFITIVNALCLSIVNFVQDTIVNARFYCLTDQSGQEYTPFLVTALPEQPAERNIITIFGALLHFLLVSYLFWVSNTIAIIMLTISFPSISEKLSKGKYYIITTQALATLILSCIGVSVSFITYPEAPYDVLIYLQLIAPNNVWAFILTYLSIVFVFTGIVGTFSFITLVKVRVSELRVMGMSNKKYLLSGFEKRILSFGVIITLLLILGGVTTIALFIYKAILIESLIDLYSCITYNSPISSGAGAMANLAQNKTLGILTNSTFTDNLLGCERLMTSIRDTYPVPLIFANLILSRTFWFVLFIIITPTCGSICMKCKIVSKPVIVTTNPKPSTTANLQ